MPSRHVVLVNPNRMQPPIGPIGLEYVADALDRRGFDLTLCDLTFESDWRAALRTCLAGNDTLAVLVSVRNLDDAYFASQDFILEPTTEIIKFIREYSAAPVCLGGVGFSIAPKAILGFTIADYGIAGDGEEALAVLLDCIAANGPVDQVPGAVYRDNDGNIRANPHARCDVEARPTPRRAFFDNRRYFAEGGQAGIETKRGCAMPCIYCVEPPAKTRFIRLRSPGSVVAEFQDLLDQGIDAVHLCDSEFNLPPAHAKAVCDALIESGVAAHTRWYTYAYPVPFDDELARNMKRAGCAGVNFGVDHLDEKMLRRLGRGYTADDVRRTVETCRAAGLNVMLDMLLGAPGETKVSLANAIESMREINPDRVGLSCGVRIYPNTLLADQVRAQGPLESNRHLHGTVHDNRDLLRPIFYVDAGLETDIHDYVEELVAGDSRFLHANPNRKSANYNYNDNSALVNAIRNGERGAYWDILRRIYN